MSKFLPQPSNSNELRVATGNYFGHLRLKNEMAATNINNKCHDSRFCDWKELITRTKKNKGLCGRKPCLVLDVLDAFVGSLSSGRKANWLSRDTAGLGGQAEDRGLAQGRLEGLADGGDLGVLVWGDDDAEVTPGMNVILEES